MFRRPLAILIGIAILAAACSEGFDGLTTGEPGVGPAAVWEVPEGDPVKIGQGPWQGQVRIDSACVVLVVTSPVGKVTERTLAFPEPSTWNPETESVRFVDGNSGETAEISDGDAVTVGDSFARYSFSTRPASSCPDDVFFVESVLEVTPG